jgi:nitroreductase/ferredoxin
MFHVGRKTMSKVKIDNNLCIKDNQCVMVCPQNVIIQRDKDSFPEIVNEKLCISCGHCVAICPQGAIIHREFTQSLKTIKHEIIPSFEQIFEMLRARRSIRVFKDQPIEKELIQKIIDGARYAPNAKNVQSTEIIIIQDKPLLKKIVEVTALFYSNLIKKLRNPLTRRYMLLIARNDIEGALRLLPDFEMVVSVIQNGQDQILHNAPVLLIFHAKKNVSFSDVNANLALHNASLVSQVLGIGSFYVGYVAAACKRDKHIQG